MKKTLTPKLQKIQMQLDSISASFRRHAAAENYAQAAADAMRTHKLIPALVVPLSDAVTAAAKGGLWDDAIIYAKKALQRDPEHISPLDALSHAYGGKDDWENVRIYGLQALQLRGGKIAARSRPPLSLPTFKPDGRKIISFSLFDGSSAYIEPAVLNAETAKDIYSEWTCRFYVDDSVPDIAIGRLRSNGAEIIRVDVEEAQWPGTIWRLLAADDAEASQAIFRDADSAISHREAEAVKEWMASSKLFHTIRDAETHTELILAGLWGMAAGTVPDMKGKIRTHLQQPLVSKHFTGQFFLRGHIQAYARQSLFAYDRIFGFPDAKPFSDDLMTDYRYNHIGCDEGNSHFQADYDLPDGSGVVWKLYSRIAPLLTPSVDIRTLPEERLVCEYRTTVNNRKISGYIPRRYSEGFAQGSSRMVVMRAEEAEQSGAKAGHLKEFLEFSDGLPFVLFTGKSHNTPTLTGVAIRRLQPVGAVVNITTEVWQQHLPLKAQTGKTQSSVNVRGSRLRCFWFCPLRF